MGGSSLPTNDGLLAGLQCFDCCLGDGCGQPVQFQLVGCESCFVHVYVLADLQHQALRCRIRAVPLQGHVGALEGLIFQGFVTVPAQGATHCVDEGLRGMEGFVAYANFWSFVTPAVQGPGQQEGGLPELFKSGGTSRSSAACLSVVSLGWLIHAGPGRARILESVVVAKWLGFLALVEASVSVRCAATAVASL